MMASGGPSEAERLEIERRIKRFLVEFDCNVVELKGDMESRWKKVYDTLHSYSKKHRATLQTLLR